MSEIVSKTQQVRELVAAGDYKKALQICKEWDYEPSNYSDVLRRGYDCLMYPDFYKQLGKDPLIEYRNAVNLLKKIYG